MTVREIDSTELPLTVPLAKRFHDQAGFDSEFSETRFATTLMNALDAGILGAFGMFDGDKLVGLLLGIIGPQFLVEANLAQELMWWVDPEYRKSLNSVRLVMLFEEWSKMNGASAIVMARFTEADDNRLDNFYRRRGFREIETHYLKKTSCPLPLLPRSPSQQPLPLQEQPGV